jgi:hypothetical protein
MYVIDEKNIIDRSIDDPQVFDVADGCLIAAISKVPMAYIFLVWIQIISNNIPITFMTGRKYNDLKYLR